MAHNIGILQKTGYAPVATFVLPRECWTLNYFAPRRAAESALLAKYPGNAAYTATSQMVAEVAPSMRISAS